MKNPFGKNDKLLFHASIAVDVFGILDAIACVIYSIVTIVNATQSNATMQIAWGIISIPLGLVLSFIAWVFMKVVINLYCDVKLIRNHMYSIDNDYLRGLTGDDSVDNHTENNSNHSETTVPTYENDKLYVPDNLTDKVTKLKAIKELFDNGILTAEEFESEKNKILNAQIQ